MSSSVLGYGNKCFKDSLSLPSLCFPSVVLCTSEYKILFFLNPPLTSVSLPVISSLTAFYPMEQLQRASLSYLSVGFPQSAFCPIIMSETPQPSCDRPRWTFSYLIFSYFPVVFDTGHHSILQEAVFSLYS